MIQQADFRGQAGLKRARTDGNAAVRGEGDWTCPQCGNVNFAFRTTCNMRKCGASKPSDAGQPQRPMGGPMVTPTMYEQAPAPMYMGGPGAPPPLPMALPGSYGTPMPIPPQAVTSTVPYDYGQQVNTVAQYNPMPMAASFGPPGAVLGGGPGYATTPVMDGYGMSMGRGPPQIGGPRGGAVLYGGEENGSRKRRGGPDGFSEGDWICPKCGNTNFAFRTTCNMRKCGAPKPSEQATRYGNGPSVRAPSTSQGPPPDGSWTCEACGNVNYPFRMKCNRRNCGADKPTEVKQPAISSSPLPSDQ